MDLIKVQESLSNHPSISGTPGKDERRISDTKESSFQSQLKQVESRSFEERIKDLVNRITEQGEKLSKRMDIRELTVYKRLVAEYLDEAVGNSHSFSKRSFLDRRGRHKVFAMVKKVNEELDNLTSEILNSEKDNIKILQHLDDIRGLIVDLSL